MKEGEREEKGRWEKVREGGRRFERREEKGGEGEREAA